MEYVVHIAIITCIFSIFAQSFNFAFGLGRLFNLAHVSTYAIGAYTAALLPPYLTNQINITLGLSGTLLSAALVAALCAAPLAAIASRLSGDYFAIGTLALTYLVANALTNWRSLTNGVLGIPGIPRLEFLGWDTNNNLNFLLVAALVAAALNIAFFVITKGRIGRRLRATGEFPQAAAALGIAPFQTQGLAFLVGSMASGIAGALFALYISFIDPSSFGLDEMVSILTVVVLGGPGSVVGCVAASIGIIGLGEAMRFIPFAPAVLGPARQIVFASVLFASLWYRRDSLFAAQRTI